jgi:hypothetical protein
MKLLLPIILMLQTSVAVHAQSLEGNWNGTLLAEGTSLKLVFHITKVDSTYKSTMDSPDQNVHGIAITVTRFSYPQVKFELSNLGAVYEGVLTDDRITGKWMQSGRTFSLVLSKPENTSPDKPANPPQGNDARK